MNVGLTETEARAKHLNFGPNELPAKKPPSSLLIFLEQFKNPLIYILFFSFLVTIFLHDFKDATVILLAVFLNTILGYLQEIKARNALAALKNILNPKAMVLRDGKLKEISARDLVVGDIVILNAGEKIPADGRILEVVELTVDESILTGEATPVSKSKVTKVNNVYTGTTILTGHGKMEVVAIGRQTKIGQIANLLSETKEIQTPLQKKLSSLANFLAVLVSFLAILVLATGLLAGRTFVEMSTTSVALAVASIPEGLVVALTVILAVGMQEILKRKALVRRLLAAETLGSVTVICTDKTGTITDGKFKVDYWEVSDQELAIKLASLCNNLSDQEERALWEFILTQNHFDPQKIREENPRISEIPFSSQRKFMAVSNRMKDSKNDKPSQNYLFLKGAPETVLEFCSMPKQLKNKWEEKSKARAVQGERVLALAYKKIPSPQFKIQSEIRDLAFLGIVGFLDPPRKEAKEVLQVARDAGIKIKVLTGDFRATAETILQRVGIETNPQEILEGEELKHLTKEELRSRVSKIKLFTRIQPGEKLRIVEALQENGEVVALVGDGVNDVLALKRAEVGVVVGEACEVAKETADIILLDSNLKTLISAIEEGRRIFDNLRKVTTYLIADSFGAVILIVGVLFLDFFSGKPVPLPLTAAQILWINLISDGLPNLALAFEPKEKGLMEEPPRRPQEAIINLKIISIIAVVSLFSAFSALIIFQYLLGHDDLEMARSVIFGVLGINSLFYVFSCRSLRHSIFQTNPFTNRYLVLAVLGGFILQILPFHLPSLRSFLGLDPLGLGGWVAITLISVLVVSLIEVVKWFFSRHRVLTV